MSFKKNSNIPMEPRGRRHRNRQEWKKESLNNAEDGQEIYPYSIHPEDMGQKRIKKLKKIPQDPTKSTFLLSAPGRGHWPPEVYPEIAFWGRSNVGKSSFLNEILGQSLAHVSKTPGRTQQLNFYHHPQGVRFVDMPGYGYAQAPIKTKNHWTHHVLRYLENRPSLKHLYLLIDGRRGLMDMDLEVLHILRKLYIPFSCIVTKEDALFKAQKEKLQEDLTKHPLLKGISVFFISSKTKTGIEEIQEILKNNFFFL